MAEESPSNKPADPPQHGPTESNLSAAASRLRAGAKDAMADAGLERDGPSFATVALIGAGVAIIEPELIPGMLIGAGAWLAPKLLPALGSVLRPVVKGVVKAGYSATMAAREFAAETREQVEDIVAEARAEHEAGNAAAQAERHSAPEQSEKRQRQKPRSTPPAANQEIWCMARR
jgi:hypothetical protein